MEQPNHLNPKAVPRKIDVSIVIPVYNEEAMLRSSVQEYRQQVANLGWSFEIILAQNGSRDRTAAIADELALEYPDVRVLHLGLANYGGALRAGIVQAQGTVVICEEIDLCDPDFAARAVDHLHTQAVDIVVGSKAMAGAHDRRPLIRRLATLVYNACLRLLLGFRGTDTHGLKALRRKTVTPVAAACVIEFDVFASELVIRSQRQGLTVREIPVELREKRRPSIGLWRRVPRVLHHLIRLFVAVRFGIDIRRHKNR